MKIEDMDDLLVKMNNIKNEIYDIQSLNSLQDIRNAEIPQTTKFRSTQVHLNEQFVDQFEVLK